MNCFFMPADAAVAFMVEKMIMHAHVVIAV